MPLLRSGPSRRIRPARRSRCDVRETHSFQGLGTTVRSGCRPSPIGAPCRSQKRLRSPLQRPPWHSRGLETGEGPHRRSLVPRRFPRPMMRPQYPIGLVSYRRRIPSSPKPSTCARSFCSTIRCSTSPIDSAVPPSCSRRSSRLHSASSFVRSRKDNRSVSIKKAIVRKCWPFKRRLSRASGRSAPPIRLPGWPLARSRSGSPQLRPEPRTAAARPLTRSGTRPDDPPTITGASASGRSRPRPWNNVSPGAAN